METELVIVKKENGIATVTMNRPEVRNAMDFKLGDAIAAAFENIRGDESILVVVFCGAGKAFCAGGDIKDLKRLHDTQTVLETRDSFEAPCCTLLELSLKLRSRSSPWCVVRQWVRDATWCLPAI